MSMACCNTVQNVATRWMEIPSGVSGASRNVNISAVGHSGGVVGMSAGAVFDVVYASLLERRTAEAAAGGLTHNQVPNRAGTQRYCARYFEWHTTLSTALENLKPMLQAAALRFDPDLPPNSPPANRIGPVLGRCGYVLRGCPPTLSDRKHSLCTSNGSRRALRVIWFSAMGM